MAKRFMKKTHNKWQPRTTDAINLAAIRWFALTIEAKAIEVYGTNSAAYPNLEKVLRKCVSAVAAVDVKKATGDEGEGECPPGWVPCGDDCAPMCLEE